MAKAQILLVFEEQDTPSGVTRDTVKEMAKVMGLNETTLIHLALAKLAQEILPAMDEPDDGPLTPGQTQAIQQLAYQLDPMPIGPPREIKHLFEM